VATRTQVVLDSELHRRARERALELGISFAEYIRRLVAADLGEVVNEVDVSTVFDLGESGQSDIANEKDEYLAAALSSERQRCRF
jgi:hypothetical protein